MIERFCLLLAGAAFLAAVPIGCSAPESRKPPENKLRSSGQAATENTAVVPEPYDGYRWIRLPGKPESPMVVYSMDATSWDFAIACDESAGRLEFISQNVDEPTGDSNDRMTVGGVSVSLPTIFDGDGYGSLTSSIALSDPFVDALERSSGPIRFSLPDGDGSVLPASPLIADVVRECRSVSAPQL